MNRKERRAANRGKPKTKVIVRSEVYELIGKGGEPITLDIEPMRRWAELNAEKVSLDIRVSYIERLFSRRAVTEDRVEALMNVIARGGSQPVLLCMDINDDGDEIVDGNHTYAAFGLLCAMGQRDGVLPGNFSPRVPAYQLHPEQWRKFVVRRSAVIRTKPSD